MLGSSAVDAATLISAVGGRERTGFAREDIPRLAGMFGLLVLHSVSWAPFIQYSSVPELQKLLAGDRGHTRALIVFPGSAQDWSAHTGRPFHR